MNATIAEAVERIILAGMSDYAGPPKGRVLYERLSFDMFQACEILEDRAVTTLRDGDNVAQYWSDSKPRDADWSYDVSAIVNYVGTDGAKNLNGDLAFSRSRVIPPGRGFPPTAKAYSAMVGLDGKYTSQVVRVEWRGGKWRPASGYGIAHKSLEEVSTQLNLAAGIAFNREFEWRVVLGMPGAPTVSLKTDCSGARAIIDGRKPDGDRRAALRDWVASHWRQSRNDPDMEIFVRKHVRGKTTFEWNGMKAQIHVPAVAIAENTRLVVERRAMRRAGTDRRVKTSA